MKSFAGDDPDLVDAAAFHGSDVGLDHFFSLVLRQSVKINLEFGEDVLAARSEEIFLLFSA